MDLAKWCPDRFAISGHYCRPRRSVGPSMIANRTHTRGFRAILPKVQKTMDWMVDDAVWSEPLSQEFPCYQGKIQGIPHF